MVGTVGEHHHAKKISCGLATKKVERLAATCAAQGDGCCVLSHLHNITLYRVVGSLVGTPMLVVVV